MKGTKPFIAITMGDPSGIGPEIVLKIFSNPKVFRFCCPLVIGDLSVMQRVKKLCPLRIKFNTITKVNEGVFRFGTLDLFDLGNIKGGFKFGRPIPSLGRSMVEYILKAVELIQKGYVHAMTTGPINKTLINGAGFSYPGHTELLADVTGARKVAMMLVGGPFRITLVTTHLSIENVPKSLSKEKIFDSIQLTDRALREKFRIRNPRIAVASLNPHGGEEGLLGKEEKQFIRPAIDKAKGLGLNVLGPLPPDTLFYKAKDDKFDAVVVMYHDQGLIPLKMVAFGRAVNVTLGLPIIRTSVDHGTAYDIAGCGKADPSSLFHAVSLAADLARKGKKRS
jgi:4-hydroxythreonine-4-phosphate dehydrogenase